MKKNIEIIAKDSRINIENAKRLYADLSAAKKMVDKLDELSVDGIELFSEESVASKSFREDKVNNPKESILFKNAPNIKNNCIVIPKIKGV